MVQMILHSQEEGGREERERRERRERREEERREEERREEERREEERTEERTEEGRREWYIRLENLYLNDSFMGYKRIITFHDSDLADCILAYYSLPTELRGHMRIYSGPFRRRRLDGLLCIPEEHVFLSVYFY